MDYKSKKVRIIHRTYISDIEYGVKNVSVENIEKIAVAMNLEIKELF